MKQVSEIRVGDNGVFGVAPLIEKALSVWSGAPNLSREVGHIFRDQVDPLRRRIVLSSQRCEATLNAWDLVVAQCRGEQEQSDCEARETCRV